ncbi:MAG: hypothetical protein M3680_18160 [Myxococcota bacterium]|nr:hypothetical protein [Myxococcota bacterium]
MSGRRRAVFATPFVIVVGCSQPADRAVVATGPTLQAPPRDAAAAVAATDAAAEAPEPQLTHERWAERKAAHEAGVKACARVTHPCNPPPPPPPEPRRPDVMGEVFVSGAGGPGELVVQLVVIDGSSITDAWRGVFVDSRGTSIPGTDFVLGKRITSGRYRATLRRATLPSRTVRLSPPPE